jgi:hypothetical protein
LLETLVMMRDLPSALLAPAANDRSQQARVLHRLYGMKVVTDSDLSGGCPVEILDSTSMDTKPLRRR